MVQDNLCKWKGVQVLCSNGHKSTKCVLNGLFSLFKTQEERKGKQKSQKSIPFGTCIFQLLLAEASSTEMMKVERPACLRY
jgi:hypothetical protein